MRFFSQKCSAAWQGAPGQRLTVAIMLPGRQVKMQMTGLLHAVAKEPLAHLYNSGVSHRGDFRTDLSQGTAQAAGQASLDGGQAALERFG